ncbi:MAG: hypothetical protein ABUT39_25520 [Acidobacteriota bacterium]
MRNLLTRFLLPLAVLGAIAAFSVREAGPAAGEGLFLGELAAAVLLVVAALAPGPAAELGLGATLAVTAVWSLPPGPGRGATVVLLLLATFGISAVQRLSRVLPELPAAVTIPLALGAQLFLRSELLFEPVTVRTLVALLALPVVAGLALTVAARRIEGPLVLIAAAVALALGPGWNVRTTAAVIVLGAASLLLKRRIGRLPASVAVPAGTLLAVLLAVMALLDAYPWRREQPLRDALGLARSIPDLFAAGTPLLDPETSIPFDADRPTRDKDLPLEPITSIVIESALSNGAPLADGTPVAVIRLTDEEGRSVERTLRAGSDTGEWAARRSDVLRTARLRSPGPWITWIAGDFFAQRYRCRWDLPPGRYTRMRIERSPGLPRNVSLAVHQVELRGPGLARALSLAPGDPFRGTLLVLPLILAALAWIHRRSIRQGALPLDRRGTFGEIAALAGLVLLIWMRPHLNLGRADEVLAAGLLLVLGHRVLRQVLALRPLLGERVPDWPSAAFFLLPLAAYLAILPWSTFHRQPDGDEPYNLLITHSLAYDFDADLTNNYADGDWRHFMDRPIAPQPGDPVDPDGRLYSRHNEALPMVLAPAYRLAGKTGALAVMAAFTAALAWMTLRLARRYVPDRPGEVLAVWALAAFAPPLLLYSYQVWVEVPATLLLVVALDRILGFDGRRWDWAEWLGIGLPVLLLPLVKMRFMLIAVPLVAMAWWYSGRPRKPILILSGLLSALGAGMLLYNQFVYSNPLKIHSWEEIDPQRHTWIHYLQGGLGLFWDTAFGLFGCAPVWMLLLPAAVLLLARRSRLLVHLAVLSAPYLLIVAPRTEWYGGWSPPFRYALIALPLLALGLVPLLAGRRGPGARALIAGLATLTLALTLVWVVVPGWTYNFANGRTYPLDHLGERLGEDLARFFPSSVRPRPATWIWPPVSLGLAALAWWLPLRKRSREGSALAGVALAIAGAAALPAVAARMPTRTVEMEDAEVSKSGGHVHPDLWIIERARYRGGWVLRIDETLKAPVNPGGSKVTLALHGEFIRNQPVSFRLDVRAGDRLLAIWTPGRSRVWEKVVLGPFDWPAGEPLVLAAYGPHPPGALNGAILDRVDFHWEK